MLQNQFFCSIIEHGLSHNSGSNAFTVSHLPVTGRFSVWVVLSFIILFGYYKEGDISPIAAFLLMLVP